MKVLRDIWNWLRPSILHRYIARRLLYNFFTSLMLLTGVVLLLSLAKFNHEARSKGFDFLVIIQGLPNVLPSILSLTLPIGLAVATVVTFGHLAEHNEFTAIKAAGVSPFWLVMPVLVVGILTSALTFYVSDTLTSISLLNLRQRILKSVEDNLRSNARPGRGLELSLDDGTELKINFLPEHEQDKPLSIAVFREGQWQEWFYAQNHNIVFGNTADEGALQDVGVDLSLEDGELLPGQPGQVLQFTQHNRPFTVPNDLATRVSLGNKPSTRSVAWNITRRHELQDDVVAARQQMAGILAEMSARGLAVNETGPIGRAAQPEPAAVLKKTSDEIADITEARLESAVEVQRRLSSAFSALAFVLLAMPVGLRFGRGGPIKCGMLGVMIVAFFFYPPLAMARQMADTGVWSPLTLWLPTAGIAVAGAVMLRRIFMTT